MSNLLKAGAEWLESQRKTHLTSPVTYSRGSASVSVQATIGRTTFETDRQDGVHIDEQARDYVVTVDDLVLDGVPVEPRSGDHIVEDAAPALTYEVMAPEGVEQAWRYSDSHRLAYRIHTKLVATS